MKKNNNLLIIDAYGFVFRAFYIQPRLTNPEGVPINAVYGFTSMLIKLLNDFESRNIVIVFDGGGKNFRHALYPDYKAHRPPIPEDLRVQLPLVRKVAESLNISMLECYGVEADDIIATVAHKANLEGKLATIVSPDKDLTQLINHNINVYDPVKNKFVDADEVFNKFGVQPNQVRDYLAIVGDAADNIPGVSGVGPKGAADLLNQFGSLSNIWDNLHNIASAKRKENLVNSKEAALLSWELVGLRQIDVDFELANFAWQAPEKDLILSFLNEFGFKSLVARIEKLCGFSINEEKAPGKLNLIDIDSLELLDEKISNIIQVGWVSLRIDLNKIYFTSNNIEILIIDLNRPSNIAFAQHLISSISDDSVKKITFDIKTMLHLLAKYDIEVSSFRGFEDLMLMYYIKSKNLDTKITPEKVIFSLIEEEIQSHLLILYFHRVFEDMRAELFTQKVLDIYYDIDLPLAFALYNMEVFGIKINSNILGELGTQYKVEIQALEKQIFNICGRKFNLSSPKQLGEVLFDWLKLPGGKLLRKSNSYTTNAEVLENLSDQGFEGADLLLMWRKLNKLLNTYILPLLEKALNGSDRIYTTFLQTSTLTARLSSVEPNLQNIPIKTPEGSKIRAAFVVNSGNKLISADYSQIELRVLSYIADIINLKNAFLVNQDVHAITASEIFNIPLDQIDNETRRKAKAINFGIIYGISAFGLAKQLKIPQSAAKLYIDIYLERYPGIAEYMNATKNFALHHGYVETIIGRKCGINNINSTNANLRSLAERTAINARIQGSAADIMRIAMLEVQKVLIREQCKTKMMVQIHDELLFEAPADEVELVVPLIKSAMENILITKIPLIVNISSGDNWYKS